MAIRFSADEILRMAEQIEDNGAKFYRRAAQLHPQENSAFLLKLAAMEDDHKITFAKMRAHLTDKEKESTAYDPMNEGLLYLKTMADLHGGEGDPDVTASLTGRESMETIIFKAIELEKQSILFYIGLQPLVPRELGHQQIDRIIMEEKSHVVILSRELNELRKMK